MMKLLALTTLAVASNVVLGDLCTVNSSPEFATTDDITEIKLVSADEFDVQVYAQYGDSFSVAVALQTSAAGSESIFSTDGTTLTIDLASTISTVSSASRSKAMTTAGILAVAASASGESPAAGAAIAALGMVHCANGELSCTHTATIGLLLTDGQCYKGIADSVITIGPCVDATSAPTPSATTLTPTSAPTTGTPTAAPTTGTPTAEPTASPIAARTIKDINADIYADVTGARVVVEGIVTASRFSEVDTKDGFYIQMTKEAADADPTVASEATFVYCGFNCADLPAFEEGDLVAVTGFTGAYFGNSQLSSPSVEVLCSDKTVTLNAAAGIVSCSELNLASLVLPVASTDEYEAVRQMLVAVAQPMTVTDTYSLRYGTIRVSSGGRAFAATMQVPPGETAQAQEDADSLRFLGIDDGWGYTCPTPTFWPIANAGPAFDTIRGGDVFSTEVLTATSIITEEFSTWTLIPSTAGGAYMVANIDQSENPRVPSLDGIVPANDISTGAIRISALNVENYFLTLGCDACRGAATEAEFLRQEQKIFNSIVELDAAIFALQELENNGTVVVQMVERLNDFLGEEGKYTAIDAGVVGEDAITVGIIYQSALVEPVGDFATLDYSGGNSRTALAQTFKIAGGSETADEITVFVQHFKSKGSQCAEDIANEGILYGEGSCGPTRLLHVQEFLAWSATNPTGSSTDKYAVLGDFNMHRFDRGLEYFVTEGGYVNLADRDIAVPHSYQFDGFWSTLDYFMASPSLAALCADTYEWHINSDESLFIDYNDASYFNTACQDKDISLYFDGSTPYRGSDHDPIVSVCTLAL